MKRLSSTELKAIGDEVRGRRRSAGLTLNALSERAELNKNYLSKIELGQVDFSISALWSIAVALECEVEEFFPSTKHALTPDALATAHMLSDATPEVRAAVMTLMESISSIRGRLRPRGPKG